MGVSDHINYLKPTTNIINKQCPNRQIIMTTMEGELYLSMLPITSRQAHILLNIIHSLVSI